MKYDINGRIKVNTSHCFCQHKSKKMEEEEEEAEEEEMQRGLPGIRQSALYEI